MTKLLNRTFLHSYLKMAAFGIKFADICIRGKPKKSAKFIPSCTIFKVVQKSLICIFVMTHAIVLLSPFEVPIMHKC